MNDMLRKLAAVAALGVAFAGAFHVPHADAREYVVVTRGVAPPPPRFERVPPPRRGFVWVPGFWRWDGYAHRHVWVGGHWVRARPGYRYVPARWERVGPGWRFHGGYWGR
jgi:hypothetical protein